MHWRSDRPDGFLRIASENRRVRAVGGLSLAESVFPPGGLDSAVVVPDSLLLLAQESLPRSAGKSTGVMVKRIGIAALAVLTVVIGTTFAQQELNFLGRYDDAKYIKQDKSDTTQFVFTRLIYNGRILGYYKNWYTDYPKGDEQLM